MLTKRIRILCTALKSLLILIFFALPNIFFCIYVYKDTLQQNSVCALWQIF